MKKQDMDMNLAICEIHKNLKKRYKTSFEDKVSNVFTSIGIFIFIMFALPFFTLIKIFQIIFNNK